MIIDGKKAVRAKEVLPKGFKLDPNNGFIVPSSGIFSDMESWNNIQDVEIGQRAIWTHQKGSIDHVKGSTVVMKAPFWRSTRRLADWGIGMTYPEVIENAYELLDEEGEWYLDRTQKFLYYIPRKGEEIQKLCVELPVLEQLVEVQGTIDQPVKNLVFDGIVFENNTNLAPLESEGWPDHQAGISENKNEDGTTYDLKSIAALEFDWAHNITVKNCMLNNLGSGAIAFDLGSQNNHITNNIIKNVGGNGIMIGDVNWGGSGLNEIGQSDHHPEDERCVVKNNIVDRNVIQFVGEDFQSSVGIMCGFTLGTVLDHNTLFDLPYTAISVGWGWGNPEQGDVRNDLNGENKITYNRIDNVMCENNDGGAIYTLGRQDNSVIRYNYMSNLNNNYAYIYLDNGSRGYTVEYNVIDKGKTKQNNWYMSNDMGGKGDPIQTYNNICRYNYYTNGMEILRNPAYCTVGANCAVKTDKCPEYAIEIMNHAGVSGETMDQVKIPDFSENYALMKDVSATSALDDYFLYSPQKAVDGKKTTKWIGKQGESEWSLEVDLADHKSFDTVVVEKENIEELNILALCDGSWKLIGSLKDDNVLLLPKAITANKVKIEIVSSKENEPQIAEIGVYSGKIPPDMQASVVFSESYENGAKNWIGIGNPKLEIDKLDAYNGDNSLKITNRTAEWNGAQYPINDIFQQYGAGEYHIKTAVKSEQSGICKVGFSLSTQSGPKYLDFSSKIAAEWTVVEGTISITEEEINSITDQSYLTINTVDVTNADILVDAWVISKETTELPDSVKN